MMGNCRSCCKSCLGYKTVGGEDDETTALFGTRFDWEQHVLDDSIMKSEVVSKAAIVSYSDGFLRAAAPKGFNPDKKGIKDIIKALQGDTRGILERSISLGSGTRECIPGKVDKEKAIFGADAHGGGCVVFKTSVCLLIVFYSHEPTVAVRLASEVAEYMSDQGH